MIHTLHASWKEKSNNKLLENNKIIDVGSAFKSIYGGGETLQGGWGAGGRFSIPLTSKIEFKH